MRLRVNAVYLRDKIQELLDKAALENRDKTTVDVVLARHSEYVIVLDTEGNNFGWIDAEIKY